MAEVISNINPERIRWCLQQVGMDMAELVNKKQIPKQKLESGKLTYRQLKKVAAHFDYSPLFFLNPEEPQTENILSPDFCTLAKQSVKIDNTLARIIRRTEWHRDLYISLIEELGEETNYAPPKIAGTITQRADAVKQWLGIQDTGEYKFEDYRKLIEAKGILVFQSMGYSGAWQLKNNSVIGFSIMHPQVPLIFIKKTSPQIQIFTLFHELGHLLLHKSSHIDDKDNLNSNQSKRNEQEANLFAANCLLPENIQRAASSSFPRSYRHMEPLQIFGYNYVATVLDALHTNKVTLNKASDYLDRLKINDIKKLDDALYNAGTR